MSGNIAIHLIFSIILSFAVHLLLHETGHMLAGLLTGWKLVYIQLFNLAIVKVKSSYQIKIFKTRNYQCIMMPKNIDTNPFIYTLGGFIANFLSAIACMPIIMSTIIRCNNILTFLYSWSFLVMGLGFCFMNGIPRIDRICNDMACYRLIKHDSLTRHCHNTQLIAAKLLNEGYTYKQIGEEMLCLHTEKADNDILAYQAILEYYYCLDTEDYTGQISALAKIKDECKLSHSIVSYLSMERIYMVITDKIKLWRLLPEDYIAYEEYIFAEKERIEELEKYMKMYYIKGDIHMERIKAVFNAYKELAYGSCERAREKIKNAIDILKNISCVYSGEKEFCIRQLKLLQEELSAQMDV